MAITSTQQTEILKVVAGLFNAAPGGTNLSDLANAVSGGMTIKQLANVLASNTLFTNGIMAGKVTTDDQAAVLMNNFGLVADDTTTSAGSQALAYFKAQIDAKVGFGDIVFDAVTFLSGSSVPAEFTEAATLLANKALVAASYSASNSSSDLSTLQSVVSEVAGTAPYTAADVTAALASVGDTVAPTVTAGSFDYNENLKAGDAVATVVATDNVAVGSFNIVSGDTSGFFAIDATGKITLTTAGLASAMNDFETTPNTATLGITATDKAGNTSTTATVTVNVKDVDDVAPAFKSAVVNGTTATVSFSEALSTTAATPAIADFAIGIKGGSGSISVSALQVTGSTVVLTLGRAPATGETFTVAYTQGANALQDAAGNKADSFAAKDVVVDTTAPTVTAGQTFTFVEAISDGKGGLTGPVTKTTDVIGTVVATDNTGVVSFAIASGNDKSWFALDSATGKLTLTTAGLTAATNDFETTPNSFSLGITAKDGAGNVSSAGSVTVSVTNNTADDATVTPGGIFSLTTAAEVLSPNSTVAANKTTTGDDQIFGLTAASLTSADIIDGSGGTDSIIADYAHAADGLNFTIAPVLTSVENVTIRNTSVVMDGGEITTFSAANSTGIKSVTFDQIVGVTAASALVANNLDANVTSVGISKNATLAHTYTFTYADAAVSGTADTVTLNATGNTVATGAVLVRGTTSASTGAGVETVKVVTSGTGTTAASTFASLLSADGGGTTSVLKTLDISGTADLTITAAIDFAGTTSGTVTSASSGKTTLNLSNGESITFTGGSGEELITLGTGNDTVKSGAGNDKVTIALANLTTGDSIDLSDGTRDAIVYNNVTTLNSTGVSASQLAALNAQKGVEVIGSSAALTAIDASYFTQTVYRVDAALTAALTMSNIAGDTLELGAGITGVNADALTLSGTLPGQTATLEFNGAAAVTLAGTDGTAGNTGLTISSNITTVNILSSTTGTAAVTNAIANAAATTATHAIDNVSATNFVLTGTQAFTITKGATAGFTNGVNFDASTGFSGVLTIDGSASADVIKGGSGNDVIEGMGGNDQLTGGTGSDNFEMLSATIASGNDTITDFTVGASNDKIDLGYLTIPGTLTTATMTGAAVIATNTIYTVNYGAAIGSTDFSVAGATGFDLLFGTGKAFGTTVATTNDFLIVVQGTDKTVLLAIENPAATTLASTDIDAVVTLTGVTNSAVFEAGNFI